MYQRLQTSWIVFSSTNFIFLSLHFQTQMLLKPRQLRRPKPLSNTLHGFDIAAWSSSCRILYMYDPIERPRGQDCPSAWESYDNSYIQVEVYELAAKNFGFHTPQSCFFFSLKNVGAIRCPSFERAIALIKPSNIWIVDVLKNVPVTGFHNFVNLSFDFDVINCSELERLVIDTKLRLSLQDTTYISCIA